MSIALHPIPVNGTDEEVLVIFEDEVDAQTFSDLKLVHNEHAIVMLDGVGYFGVEIKQDLGRSHLALLETGIHHMAIGYWRAEAEEQGIEFGITARDLAWPRRCPALGIELEWGRFFDEADLAAPVLSRTEPELGYVPGNCIVVSRRAKDTHGGA